MLVRFALDSESLHPDENWTPSACRHCHLSLLAMWHTIGVLTYDGETFTESRVFNAIKGLPQNLRPLWMEALEHALLESCKNRWNGLVRKATVPDLPHSVGVALVDDVCAEVEFDLDAESLSAPPVEDRRFEVCRISASSSATAFREALAKSGLHIEERETFRQIWDERFHGFAAASIKNITIIDRFALSQHYECPHDQLSGLTRFLLEMDKSATGVKHLTLFSAWTDELRRVVGDDWDEGLRKIEAEVRDVIAPKLTRKNIKRLRIVMLPNGLFGSLHHDRYVRFGNYVVDIGVGLKVLQGAYCSERSTLSLKSGAQVASYKKAEHELAGHQNARTIEIQI